jgi:hypothetical protein
LGKLVSSLRSGTRPPSVERGNRVPTPARVDCPQRFVGAGREVGGRAAALLGLVAFVAATACSNEPVPYFDGPTSVPISTTGIQNAVTGLFSATRLDVQWYVYFAGSFGRDLFLFAGFSPNLLTDVSGLSPSTNAGIPTSSGLSPSEVWNNEYAQIKASNTIIAGVAKVTEYNTQQAAAIVGIVQTIKALNFMMVAETRDTLGIPLYAVDANPIDPPYCNQDVWAYIVSLLDSGLTNLNAAGAIPLPVILPPGFASVGQTASPSTAAGSFASFNRALAGKAGLELAYAIARSTAGGSPTVTLPGSPDQPTLLHADSQLVQSALYDLSAIAPPPVGDFPLTTTGVYHTFSGQSGDLQNGIVPFYFFYNALWDLAFDVDTVNDLRWTNKFAVNTNGVQFAPYSGVSVAKTFLPYATVGSPMPIVRAEELALVRAQIQLGLGKFAAASALINVVHEKAGGFATPLSIAPTYTAVRDSLLKEQRISTVFEASGDRMIALRMYGLEAIADTTWQATGPGPDAVVVQALLPRAPVDYHTTVAAVPFQEFSARGGQWILTCPPLTVTNRVRR